MRRARPAKAQISVSLFPFLAVLICTMGALIVLLVLVVQQARVQADTIAATRDEQQQADSAALASLRRDEEDHRWRADVLTTQRSELTQQLADRRLALSHLEDHIRRLEENMKILQAQAGQILTKSAGSEQDQEAARFELARLQAALETEQRRLDEARREATGKRQSYAIIPYRGPNGTQRRPIYIECTKSAITIQPEGLTLGPQDFAGPLGPGNPLDASLRAIREHWSRVEGGSGGGEPYPLLIVRPDGAVAYSMARAALASWDDEFGYELVDAEMQLAFPPTDPRLAATLLNTVKVARQRQELLAAAMPSRFGRKKPDTFESPEPPRGASGTTGSGGDGVGGSSSRAIASQSRGGGTGVGGSVQPQTNPYFTGTGTGDGIGDDGDGIHHGGTEARSSSGNSLAGAHGDGDGTSTGTAAGSEFGIGRDGAGGGSGTARDAAGQFAGQPNNPLRNPGDSGSGPYGSGSSGQGRGSQTGTGQIAGSPGADGSGTGASGTGASGASASGASASGTSAVAGTNGPGTGSSSQPASSANRGAAGGSPGSGSSTIASATAGSIGAGASAGASGAANAKCLADSRGADWALDDRMMPNSTGITRPISVECRRDQLILLPEKGSGGQRVAVPLDGPMHDAIDPFVAAIRKRIDSWGIAVSGGYWKPVLKVTVAPGAETQFTALQTVLQDSGIEVARREQSATR